MSYKVPFHFDGHGVNDADGQRICKVQSCEPYTYETGLPIRNTEFDGLSHLFAAAPELLEACQTVLARVDHTNIHTTLEDMRETWELLRTAITTATKY